MTRRVLPNTLGNQVDNHLRRIRALEALSPDACCVNPWVRLMLSPASAPVESVADGQQLQVNFDPELTVGSDDWEDFFTLQNDIFGNPHGITLIEEGGGFMEYTAEVIWDDDFPETAQIQLTLYGSIIQEYSKAFSHNQINGLEFSTTHCMYFREQVPDGTSALIALAQASGITQDVRAVYFQAMFVGFFTGPEPSDYGWQQ